MESDKSQLSEKAQAKRGFSIVSVVQFLGASSIVAIATWSLNSIISAKSNQQEQLNTFINTISDFMIKNNLDGQTTKETLENRAHPRQNTHVIAGAHWGDG